jgi:sugar transferase (PEP-CTERM/EpsH1 system associated)
MSKLIEAVGKKTILHIVISFETGGLERFVLDLIRLSGDQFNHKVVCLESPGELISSSGMHNVTCLYLKPGLQIKGIIALNSIIKANQIDLIHTHNEKALFYGAISGLLSRIPVVHTKHGKNQVTLKARVRNNLLARLCKKIIAVSQDAALQCVDDEKISAEKVMVILNGADINAFSGRNNASSIRKSLGVGDGVPLLGIVARLAEVKDHATLFHACNIIYKNGIDFKLIVVGDGILKNKLTALSDSLGLKNNIVFTGTRRDIPAFLSAMDIFVLSSISEGISLTLIEAMSSYLPIVATNVGGNSEVIIDGETGFLVPPKNPEALADKLTLLINNPDLQRKMGDAGRDRAVKHFSMQKSVMNYEQCYSQIIGK